MGALNRFIPARMRVPSTEYYFPDPQLCYGESLVKYHQFHHQSQFLIRAKKHVRVNWNTGRSINRTRFTKNEFHLGSSWKRIAGYCHPLKCIRGVIDFGIMRRILHFDAATSKGSTIIVSFVYKNLSDDSR